MSDADKYVATELDGGGVIVEFVNPPPIPHWADTNLDERYWWINIGPFFDRFNGKALSITSSTDPVVQGMLTLILPRQYVDLKRADLSSMLDLLISKSLITSGDKSDILSPPTTEYERHIKGMVQPL